MRAGRYVIIEVDLGVSYRFDLKAFSDLTFKEFSI
jgi:hypothetical protein